MTSPAPAYDYSPRSAFTEDWNHSLPNQDILPNPKEKKDSSQPGLEVFGDEGKEVVPQPVGTAHAKEKPYPDQDAKYPVNPEGHAPEEKRRRICGIGIPLFWGLIALLIITAVALGVGLGVGLNHKKTRCVMRSVVTESFWLTQIP